MVSYYWTKNIMSFFILLKMVTKEDIFRYVLLNRMEHEYICCDADLVINGRF